MICDGCGFLARRGGTILPSTRECIAPEQAGFGPAQAAFLSVVMRSNAAAVGACPHHTDPPDAGPDAYQSIDLEGR